GEISAETSVLNCKTGERLKLRSSPFYAAAQAAPPLEHAAQGPLQQPLKGGIRANLQKRVRELEQLLLERTRQLNTARDTISRHETRIKELEARVKELEAGRPRAKI
ncbi:MAG: hypothetical protein N2322_07620, partial [Terrimicrobiaceae bacterium]|nr:hypothetical protein [Terrimicrobiaceae bacterium]